MDDLPGNANLKLPSHNKTGDSIRCSGGEVVDVFSDVGSFIGKCPMCDKTFVYLTSSDTWMEEEQFDRILQENNPLAGNTGLI